MPRAHSAFLVHDHSRTHTFVPHPLSMSVSKHRRIFASPFQQLPIDLQFYQIFSYLSIEEITSTVSLLSRTYRKYCEEILIQGQFLWQRELSWIRVEFRNLIDSLQSWWHCEVRSSKLRLQRELQTTPPKSLRKLEKTVEDTKFLSNAMDFVCCQKSSIEDLPESVLQHQTQSTEIQQVTKAIDALCAKIRTSHQGFPHLFYDITYILLNGGIYPQDIQTLIEEHLYLAELHENVISSWHHQLIPLDCDMKITPLLSPSLSNAPIMPLLFLHIAERSLSNPLNALFQAFTHTYLPLMNGHVDETLINQKLKEMCTSDEIVSHDKCLLQLALRNSVIEYEDLHEGWRGDIDLACEAVKSLATRIQDYVLLHEEIEQVLGLISSDLFKSLQFMTLLVSVPCGGEFIRLADKALLSESSLVVNACRTCGFAISYAPDGIRNQRDVILDAVKSEPFALQYVTDQSVFEDEHVCITACRTDPDAITFFGASLRGKGKLMYYLVVLCLVSLKHATDSLKRDVKFLERVIMARESEIGHVPRDVLEENPHLYFCVENPYKKKHFRFVPQILFTDNRVFREAIHNAKRVRLENAECTKVLINDANVETPSTVEEFVELALQHTGMNLEHLPANLRDDESTVLTAVNSHGYALQFTPQDSPLRKNMSICLRAVSNDFEAMEFCDSSLLTDKALVLQALKHDCSLLSVVHPSLRDDIDVLYSMLEEDPKSVLEANREMLCAPENRVLLFRALRQNIHLFQELDENLRSDRQLALFVIDLDALMLEHMDESLRDDFEVVLLAVKSEALAVRYASERLFHTFQICFQVIQHKSSSFFGRVEVIDLIPQEYFDNFEMMISGVACQHRLIDNVSQRLKSDREFVLRVIRIKGSMLEHVDPIFLQDREVVCEALATAGYLISLNEDWLKDKELALIAVESSPSSIYSLDAALKQDRDVVLASLKRPSTSAMWFRTIPQHMWKDHELLDALFKGNGRCLKFFARNRNLSEALSKDAILLALQQDGLAIQYLPKKWRWDEELVQAALARDGLALQYLWESDKDANSNTENEDRPPSISPHSRETILIALCQNGLALQYSPLCDQEFALAAVQENGMALRYCSPSVGSNKDVVLAAVRENGDALQFASVTLQNDRDVVLAAVTQHGSALLYASHMFRIDLDIVLAAVASDGVSVQYLNLYIFPTETQRQIMEIAVKNDGTALLYATGELKRDQELIIEALKNTPCAIEHVHPTLFANESFVLRAASIVGDILRYLSEPLNKNHDILLACMKQNGLALIFVPYAERDEKLCFAAVKNNTEAIEWVPLSVRASKGLIRLVLEFDDDALGFAHPKLRQDREFVLECIAHVAYSYYYASDELKSDDSFVKEACALNVDVEELVGQKI